MDEDFDSVLKLHPYRIHNVKDECIGRGVSIFDTFNAAARMTKYKEHADKVVCKVHVTPESGVILKTGSARHYTWWPFRDHDILAQFSEHTQ